jgi:leader peptidase (prepilin peptidase) / N-methyltransferase
MVAIGSVVLGLIMGSFSNVCIARLPKDLSVWRPRSHCQACGRTIPWFCNIPLVSFAALRGRCYFCKRTIPWQYPLVEGLTAFFFLINAMRFEDMGFFPVALAHFFLFFLITISFIDYSHRIIPDELSISLLVTGLVLSFLNPFLTGKMYQKGLESLGATVLGGGIMWLAAWSGQKVFKREALGGGDVKLVAAFGAFLGWQGVLGSVLLGSILGGVVSLSLLAVGKKKLGETVPFGPFLCTGALLNFYAPGLLTKMMQL